MMSMGNFVRAFRSQEGLCQWCAKEAKNETECDLNYNRCSLCFYATCAEHRIIVEQKNTLDKLLVCMNCYITGRYDHILIDFYILKKSDVEKVQKIREKIKEVKK